MWWKQSLGFDKEITPSRNMLSRALHNEAFKGRWLTFASSTRATAAKSGPYGMTEIKGNFIGEPFKNGATAEEAERRAFVLGSGRQFG